MADCRDEQSVVSILADPSSGEETAATGLRSASPVEEQPSPRHGALRRWSPLLLTFLALAIAGLFVGHRLRVQPLPAGPNPLFPRPAFDGQQVTLVVPGYVLTATVAAYADELFAYLMFDYLRQHASLGASNLLLTFDRTQTDAPYRLVARGAEDVLRTVADFAALELSGTVRPNTWKLLPASRVLGFERQTALFVSAYNLPVRRKLEQLPEDALLDYVRRFIRFKSATDPRIRRRIEPVPTPLSRKEAQRLAGDVLTIAEFYSLPLDFFLGVGAMENNYMNVRGDLQHSAWKRRPAPDDVVLERRRGRVRVLNDSAGVWQITRETLRHAHQLIMKDGRDYSQLPEHLRPPAQLNVNEVSPQVLTTYAGVLLRDLLDRFDGDVITAVSAYNGGPARPNFRYGKGVQRAADHARRVVEQAAALNGESVVRMTWLRAP